MANIEVRTVWQKDDPAASRDVIALWDELGTIFPKDRPDRLKELVAAAYVDGKIAGACTARPIDLMTRRGFRTLTAARTGIRFPFLFLKGILAIFDSDAYDGLYAEPIIRSHGIELVLTGCTDEGRQIRTIWFDDAKLAK